MKDHFILNKRFDGTLQESMCSWHKKLLRTRYMTITYKYKRQKKILAPL